MVQEITIYEAFDGSMFDSLHEANSYEDRLKNQAIRSLCNHHYDEWEDYLFTLSKENSYKKDFIAPPLNRTRTYAVNITNLFPTS